MGEPCLSQKGQALACMLLCYQKEKRLYSYFGISLCWIKMFVEK